MKIPVVDLGDFGDYCHLSWFLCLDCVVDSCFVLVGMYVDGDISEKMRADFERVSRELDTAMSTVGFVYLKNHGVPQELVGTSSF